VTAPALLIWITLAVVLQLLVAITVAMRARAMPLSEVGSARALQAAWSGLRTFRVTSLAFEDACHSQCSFYLTPIDGTPLPPFRPGQFLTIAVPITPAPDAGADDNAPDVVTRCYSLSEAPRSDRYRITVKRAAPPRDRPAAPAGIVSNFFHDRVTAGTTLEVRAPSGQFMIDPDPKVPVVLIGGGIGITPLLSMLLWCLAEQPARRVTLLHGVRSGADHAFKSVVRDLALTHSDLDLHILYSAPEAGDVEGRDFTHRGVVTLDLIARIVPAGRHQYYVCGPAAMMALVVPGLAAAGIPDGDIHFEAFSPATVRRGAGALPVPQAAFDVQFRETGRTLTWDGASASLLDFAESNGITIEAGCRSGSCGTCETRLVTGSVAYAAAPEYDVTAGFCLPCVAVPQSAVVLDA
jgi:uncharacterized protein